MFYSDSFQITFQILWNFLGSSKLTMLRSMSNIPNTQELYLPKLNL